MEAIISAKRYNTYLLRTACTCEQYLRVLRHLHLKQIHQVLMSPLGQRVDTESEYSNMQLTKLPHSNLVTFADVPHMRFANEPK